MTDVSFRISTGLKNIIGRELITDDFIAVFELVKNSFDANAQNVEIKFCDLNTETPSITIKDDGVGMDEQDILNKWLFVAYSAKKSDDDYRNQIKTERLLAGAKGIGRFSCDKLGSHLTLITKKDSSSAKCLSLKVDWSRFEDDPEQEFQTIPAELSDMKQNCPIRGKQSGTSLEITNLRSKDWNREKFLKLRKSLEKLINPNQENDAENFSVKLTVPTEVEADQEVLKRNSSEQWNIVNGPIKNFILESLELKTTQIQLDVDNEGSLLKTRLTDRGVLVYEILEKNPFPQTLHSIRISLFYLNQAAKVTFTRHMGIRIFDYGSVFLYKNGFRVHPFGEPDDDSLKIDARKAQGFFRRLGSRDLSGRIEINGENPDFQETTSRDGGLIENEAFSSLVKLFSQYALPRLENYVIELAKFGKGLEEWPELNAPDSQDLRQIAFDIIIKLTESENVIALDYDPNVLDILENQSSKSVTSLLNNLKKISLENNNEQIFKEVKKAERQVAILKQAKEEAERETAKEREKAAEAQKSAEISLQKQQDAEEEARLAQQQVEEVEKQAQALVSQNLFLKNIASKDLQYVIELHHTVGQDARTIEQFVANLLSILTDTTKPIKREKFQAVLERIDYIARKIITVSRFAMHAKFQADIQQINADLIVYIREYLLNIHGGYVLDPHQQRIDIEFISSNDQSFVSKFSPINVSMVLDNLISNAAKHKSRKIIVKVLKLDKESLLISFKDDGRGIPAKNASHIFEMGFTTTDGSGLGLSHSLALMHEMHGDMRFNENSKDGAEFILTFPHNE